MTRPCSIAARISGIVASTTLNGAAEAGAVGFAPRPRCDCATMVTAATATDARINRVRLTHASAKWVSDERPDGRIIRQSGRGVNFAVAGLGSAVSRLEAQAQGSRVRVGSTSGSRPRAQAEETVRPRRLDAPVGDLAHNRRMTNRRTFMRNLAAFSAAPGLALRLRGRSRRSRSRPTLPPGGYRESEGTSGADDRDYWLQATQRIAEPVLSNLARRQLKARMPVEAAAESAADRAKVTHLEALGRLLAGIAPWLEHGARQRRRGRRSGGATRNWRAQSIDAATDPASPDRLNFDQGSQPLVDAAFLGARRRCARRTSCGRSCLPARGRTWWPR